MNALQEYLSQFKEHKAITLVGPMSFEKVELSEPLIFVDGGIRHQSSRDQGFSVGDSDSSNSELDLKLPEDKDFSDLSFVYSQIPKHFEAINSLGFMGGRHDHHLINLGETSEFLALRQQSQVNFEGKIIGLAQGEWKFHHQGVFSLFAFSPVKVHLHGEIRYSYNDVLPAHSSHGLSNKAAGPFALHCEDPLFIFFPGP